MEWIIIMIGIVLVVLGIIGAILPVLPGPILSFTALLILLGSKNFAISQTTLITMGILALGVTVLDYIIPGLGTKKFGGTKAGIRGSNIGLLVGVIGLPLLGIVIGPFGIFGIILGPFIGAYLGEKNAGSSQEKAFRSAIGSFIGFMAGTFAKLVYGIAAAVIFTNAFF